MINFKINVLLIFFKFLSQFQLVVMIVVRKLLDFFFTQRELKILDDVMPESNKRKQEEEARQKAEMEHHDVS